MSIMPTFSFFFRMNGHQNRAFSCLIGALNSPWKVNGYGADYALKESGENNRRVQYARRQLQAQRNQKSIGRKLGNSKFKVTNRDGKASKSQNIVPEIPVGIRDTDNGSELTLLSSPSSNIDINKEKKQFPRPKRNVIESKEKELKAVEGTPENIPTKIVKKRKFPHVSHNKK